MINAMIVIKDNINLFLFYSAQSTEKKKNFTFINNLRNRNEDTLTRQLFHVGNK